MSNNQIIVKENKDVVDTLLNNINDDSATKDFVKARNDINDMVSTVKSSIEELAMIASQTQHPRAFEVLAKLVDSGVNASKSLMDLQSKIRDINGASTPVTDKAKTINNVFVGSTADLQKMLKDMNGPRDITPKQS